MEQKMVYGLGGMIQELKKSEGNYIENEQDGVWSYFASDGSR